VQKITNCRIDSVMVYKIEVGHNHLLTAEMGLGAENSPCGLFTVHGLSENDDVAAALDGLIEAIEKVVAQRLGDTAEQTGSMPIQGLLPLRI